MKKTIFALLLVIMSTVTFGQKNTYQLSSHILDVAKGEPAAGVTIRLEKYNDQTKTWAFTDEKITDKNGRISDFLSTEKSNLGIYKLTYFTSDYFKRTNRKFYPLLKSFSK